MSRRDNLLLRLTSAWTVLIWAVFVKNQVGDDTTSTGFKVVHLTLAAVSIVLALLVWGVARRNQARSEGGRTPAGERATTAR